VFAVVSALSLIILYGEFVDRILVYEADRSSGKRVQRVDIYFNFIGAFDVPAPEPTAEELEAERELDKVRAKRREYNRRYQSRRKVKGRVLQPVEPRQAQEDETQTA